MLSDELSDAVYTKADLPRLFGVSRKTIWQWRGDPRLGFPSPSGSGVWSRDVLARWAARTHRDILDMTRLERLLAAGEPFNFAGAERSGATIYHRWENRHGDLAILYGKPRGDWHRLPVDLTILCSGLEMTPNGPLADAYEPGSRKGQLLYWSEVRGLLQAEPPWFPRVLSSDAALLTWRPGRARCATTPVSSHHFLDNVLAYARTFATGTPPWQVFMYAASELAADLMKTAQAAERDIAQWVENGQHINCDVYLDQRGLDQVLESFIEHSDVHADGSSFCGWSPKEDILYAGVATAERQSATSASSDAWFAYADYCSGHGPTAYAIATEPGSCAAADQWIGELRTSPYCDGHKQFGLTIGTEASALEHIFTRELAVLYGGQYRTHAGPCVRTSSELQEVHLGSDGTAWMITVDGRVHPLPGHLGWGYDGSGPRYLAGYLPQLLERASTPFEGNYAWDEQFAQHLANLPADIPHVLSRSRLEVLLSG